MTECTSIPKRLYHQARDDLDPQYLRSILNYDPESGIVWHQSRPIRPDFARIDKIWNARYATKSNRPRHKDGAYIHLRIDGQIYRAHRVAWVLFYGDWPARMIDHANGLRHDNRIANLRLVDFSKNTINSKTRSDNASGCKGVDYMPKKGMWRARINIGGKPIFLGLFGSADQAHTAYRSAAIRGHGIFVRSA